MAGHKHIEMAVADWIGARYRCPVEVGVGANWTTATLLAERGFPVRCTDIRPGTPPDGVMFFRDDIWAPVIALYTGADVIYSIRPGPEMIPPLMAVARRVDADLLVYHLGFEIWENGGERVGRQVVLHRYYASQNSKRDD